MKSNTLTDDQIIAARLKIGAQLKQLREAKGLTMEQLAADMSIGKSTVSKIEAGKWNFGIDTLIIFANALDFEILPAREG